MSEELKLGYRDAMHSGYVVAMSSVKMGPCDPVRFASKELLMVADCDMDERHGVVDPFMADAVPAGYVLRVFLMPGVAKNVRHQFDVDLAVTPEPVAGERDDEDRDEDEDDWCDGADC